MVLFDIDADGAPEQITWPERGTLLLAIDHNDNGRIDDGAELFGTAGGFDNGFHKLLVLSDALGGDRNGVVNELDPIFSSLLLWDDRNRNAVTDPGELFPASRLLRTLWLASEPINETDEHGNLFFAKSYAEFRLTGERKLNAFGVDQAHVFPIFDVNFVRVTQ